MRDHECLDRTYLSYTQLHEAIDISRGDGLQVVFEGAPYPFFDPRLVRVVVDPAAQEFEVLSLELALG